MKILNRPLAIAASLALCTLAGAAQDPGAPDELARLFPPDALVYIEGHHLVQLYKDWKQHLAAHLPAAKRDELLAQLEKAGKEALDRIPERLYKDLEKGLPTVRRVAFMARATGDGLEWAFAVSSSDAAFLPRFVNEHLKVFSSGERTHAGVLVLEIRKLDDLKLDFPVYVAAPGSRLVVSTHWAAIASALDRAAAPAAPGSDLASTPSYKALDPVPADVPCVRAFTGGASALAGALPGIGGQGTRSAAHEMDKMNAVLGLDQFGGIRLHATLVPGRVKASTRIEILGPSPLYELWRQPAGPKDLLRYLPTNAIFALHVNLKSGTHLLDGIRRIAKRYQEVSSLAHGKDDPAEDLVAEMEQSFEEETGVKLSEVFGTIGDEVSFGILGDDAPGGLEEVFKSFVLGVKVTDNDAAKRIIEAMTAKIEDYETKAIQGAQVWMPKERRDEPVFALKGKVCLIGISLDPVLAALAAADGPQSYAASLPPEAANASKLLGADFGRFWKGIRQQAAQQLPAELRELEIEARTLLLNEEREDSMTVTTFDGGLGLLFQGVWVASPAIALGVLPGLNPAFGDMDSILATPPPPPSPGPVLPPDQIAAKVKALVPDLASDDPDKREAAAGALEKLGPDAVAPVVDAYKSSTDAETRGRLLSLLMDWRAYHVLPEVAQLKLSSFLSAFPAKPEDGDEQHVNWFREESVSWTYSLEPWVNQAGIEQHPHVDFLDSAEGAKAVLQALSRESVTVEQRRRIAALLAYRTCGKAGKAILEARNAATDPETKMWLQIALGWSDDPACRAAVIAGFSDKDAWLRRASFLAADRLKHADVVDALVQLLKNPELELRWNASYTLRGLTGGKLTVNVYGPQTKIDAAARWWAENKAGYGKE